MTFLVLAVVVAGIILVWRLRHRAIWRAANDVVAARLPLGSDRIVRGAHPIHERGNREAGAALLLHGFGDTPQSLSHLARRMVDAGWTVSVPLLPGHGRTLAAFHRSHASDWMHHARAAFQDLRARHSTIVVCGQSMGAALAIELAVTEKPAAIALLAPYVAMSPLGTAIARLWPLVQALYPVLRTRDGRSIHDDAAEAQSLAYGYTTPRLLSELHSVMARARGHLSALRIPTLIVHSREDNRVSAEDVLRAAARITHPVKSLHWMTRCGHVLTADFCKDAVAAIVIDWFDRCTTSEHAATQTR